MNEAPPSPMPTPPPQKKRTVWIVVLVSVGCFCVFVLFPILVAAVTGASMFAWLKELTEVHFKSYTDTFHVTVLEMKSEPNYFMERVRVEFEEDMEVGIWVTDLKETGIFETVGTHGEIFYREGNPHKIGQSGPVQGGGLSTTNEIFFEVQTTSTNTVWHSRMSSSVGSRFYHGRSTDSMNTSLPVPMTISGVQTNWPGEYQRGSEIPLANLGNYKILLSLK